MTITTTSIKAVALGNNATTTWPFTFLIPALSDIIVTLVTIADGTETVVSQADYTVTGLGVAAGGTVEYPLSGSPLTTATKIVVERFMPEVQETDLTNQGGAYPADIEDALDYLTMICQQLQDQIDRAIVFSVADTVETTLPVAAARANKYLAFDSSGNPTASSAIAGGTTVSAAMIPVVTAATLATARTAFGFGAVALLGIGAGLRNDGLGGLAVNSAITAVSGSTAIGVAQDLKRYLLSAAMTFTAVKADTLWNGFGIWIDAVGGDATFTINAADTISGITASSWTIPKGMTCFMKCNGIDTWYPEMFGVPTVKQITGAYTISATDNFKILCHASGAFGTIIFPAGNTLPPAFRCYIYNGESTAIGKGVSGLNVGTFRLYPTQGYSVLNIANTLTLMGGIQPYKVDSIALFNNATLGSDDAMVADGLAAGARALKTQNASRNQLYHDFNHNGSQPTVTLTGTYDESVTFAGQPVNCGVFFWNGSAPGAYITRPTALGTFCFIIGDAATLEITNVTFSGNGLNAVAVQLHQTAILDVLTGCSFGAMGTGSHFASDGTGWTLNIDASYGVTGAATNHFGMIGGGTVNHAGGITVTTTGAPVIGTWFNATGSVLYALGAGVTWTGAPAAGTKKWAMGPQAAISLGGNAANVPGTVAGSPVTGSAPAAATGWATA